MKMVFVSPILLLSLGWQNQQSVLFLKIERQSRKRMLQEEWQLLLNKDHRRLKKKLRTCAQSTVVKVEISNHLGSRNGLIHFTLISMGKIVSVYEHFGLRTTFRNELSSWSEVWLLFVLCVILEQHFAVDYYKHACNWSQWKHVEVIVTHISLCCGILSYLCVVL